VSTSEIVKIAYANLNKPSLQNVLLQIKESLRTYLNNSLRSIAFSPLNPWILLRSLPLLRSPPDLRSGVQALTIFCLLSVPDRAPPLSFIRFFFSETCTENHILFSC
jgi:hypothetical protein